MRPLLFMASCYILYSARINSYYVGITTGPLLDRLARHNEGYYEGKWSSRGIPREGFPHFVYNSIKIAKAIEQHIKRMKGKTYIENMKLYPEMIEKLKSRYSGRI